MSTGFFLAFVASWAWLRQVYTPRSLCASLAVEGWQLVERYGPTDEHVCIWAAFLTLVMVVVVLHTYWFVFLLQKIKLSVRVSVSIKIVDRRPGAPAEEAGPRIEDAATGLKTHTASTLLEED